MTDLPDDILRPFLISLADDELVLGHRDSEWCAFAPMIEEDVAFASIAQDEMGHGRLYYRLAHDHGAPEPDALVFERTADGFRSAVLLERPNGDWAYTVARHLIYDIYDDILTSALLGSSMKELRDIAVLVRREERYHLEHQSVWVRHLAGGGEDSRRRLETALTRVTGEISGLTEEASWHAPLIEAGVLPLGPEEIRPRLEGRLTEIFAPMELVVPGIRTGGGLGGRLGHHTADLEEALRSLQEVWQIDTKATW